jgi:hypothetical protein
MLKMSANQKCAHIYFGRGAIVKEKCASPLKGLFGEKVKWLKVVSHDRYFLKDVPLDLLLISFQPKSV